MLNYIDGVLKLRKIVCIGFIRHLSLGIKFGFGIIYSQVNIALTLKLTRDFFDFCKQGKAVILTFNVLKVVAYFVFPCIASGSLTPDK
jgi:hypothetical protein